MNKTVTLIIRILLGAFLLIFGLNKFIGFMPPFEMSEQLAVVMEALGSSGFMSFIGILEIICGALLLIGKYIPLALTLTIAMMLNAALFHILLDTPANAGGAVIGLVLSLVLVVSYKKSFSGLLKS